MSRTEKRGLKGELLQAILFSAPFFVEKVWLVSFGKRFIFATATDTFTWPQKNGFFTKKEGVMAKKSIVVEGFEIGLLKQAERDDYISLSDIMRKFDDEFAVYGWMRNKNTVEFLGVWEQLNNPVFNSNEFGGIKNEVVRPVSTQSATVCTHLGRASIIL